MLSQSIEVIKHLIYQMVVIVIVDIWQILKEMFVHVLQTRVFEKPESGLCAAFLTNNHTQKGATVNFRGQSYLLPPHSISILPDCKTVVYNTQMVMYMSLT